METWGCTGEGGGAHGSARMCSQKVGYGLAERLPPNLALLVRDVALARVILCVSSLLGVGLESAGSGPPPRPGEPAGIVSISCS